MYINSFCSISPAGVITEQSDTELLNTVSGAKLVCIEPDYQDLIPVMQLRRMTKPVRTGVAAAKLCLRNAATSLPDAIHVGTAYGMLQDSENFLQKIIEQQEQMLTPTAFIQSTHNTVAGQIALSLGCNAHNMTYVHKAHSFESAMLDAELMLDDHPQYNVLAGAVEECTATSYGILKRFGVYNDRVTAGEGANFFTLSQQPQEDSIAQITAFTMFRARNIQEAKEYINDFLANHQLSVQTGDLLLDGVLENFGHSDFDRTTKISFKSYCGEYPTAGSFALALASAKIKQNLADRCWIINQYSTYWSIWHISKK